jgi:plastocyanin
MAVTALMIALGMLLAGGTAASPSNSVTIAGDYLSGYHFSPKKLSIKAGKKVTWSWSSDASHNVTFSTPNKHSKTAATVTSFKVKFKNAGTYRYHCTVHGFKGKIVVN